MNNLASIILAAGKGTRMRSDLAKVLHLVKSVPLVDCALKAVLPLDPSRVILIIGHQGDLVKEYIDKNFTEKIEYAWQREQKGTGHAVAQAKPLLKDFTGNILITYGDMPLVKPETLEALIESHEKSNCDVTFVTTVVDNPYGYGRVVYDGDQVIKIVEQKDANQAEQIINEINTGIYIVKSESLWMLLDLIKTNNKQGEYYLTDIVSIALEMKKIVKTFKVELSFQFSGVNTVEELEKVERILSA